MQPEQPSRFPPGPGQLPRLSPHQTDRNRGRRVKGGSSPVGWGPQGPASPLFSICPLRGRAAKLPNSVTGENTDPTESATSK